MLDAVVSTAGVIAVFVGAAAAGRGAPRYKNCSEAGDAGVAPLHQGDPVTVPVSERKPTMAEETNDGADRS